MSARRVLCAFFVAAFVPLSLFAKPPADGTYFGLKSPSGAYLSASPGEGLKLATHLAGWEQWLLGDNIISFHGTVLAVITDGRVLIHCGDLNPTSAGGAYNEVVNLTMQTPANGAADEVVLFYLAGVTRLYLSEETGGTFSFITSQLPKTKWKVVPVTSPEAGRRQKRAGIKDVMVVSLRSAHETYLMDAGDTPGKEWTTKIVHRPAPTPVTNNFKVVLSTRLQGIASSPVVALHFGETVYVTFPHQAPYGLRPSPVRNPGGHTTVEAAAIALAHWTSMERFFHWQLIDPTGVYKTGQRIPLGHPVVIRNLGLRANLSADPAYPTPQLTQNTEAWERWVVEQK